MLNMFDVFEFLLYFGSLIFYHHVIGKAQVTLNKMECNIQNLFNASSDTLPFHMVYIELSYLTPWVRAQSMAPS